MTYGKMAHVNAENGAVVKVATTAVARMLHDVDLGAADVLQVEVWSDDGVVSDASIVESNAVFDPVQDNIRFGFAVPKAKIADVLRFQKIVVRVREVNSVIAFEFDVKRVVGVTVGDDGVPRVQGDPLVVVGDPVVLEEDHGTHRYHLPVDGGAECLVV